MAKLFDLGIFSTVSSAGAPLSGAKLNFYEAGTTTPLDTYTTSALSVANANPVVADANGRFPAIWLSNDDYKYVLTTSADVTIITRDNFPGGLEGVSPYMLTVLDDTSASTARDTLGIGSSSRGALAAGTTIGWDIATSFSGHSGGTTGLYDTRHIVSATGGNNIASVRVQYNGTEITGTGTTALAEATHNYVWLKDSAAITNARVVEAHMVSSSSGAISGTAVYFSCASLTHTGSGVIAGVIGFNCGDIGHATLVTNAFAFNVADITASAGTVAAFRSSVTSGTNKFCLYSDGAAPSAHLGKFVVGSNTSPTDAFEVKGGYAKISGTTSYVASGNYHELRSANAGAYAAVISHTHATTPNGVRIYFSGGAPDNNTQRFLTCDDTGTDRMIVYSDGDLQNHDNSYGAISDKRLKQNIKDARPQLDDIKALRFRNYKMKSDVKAYGKDAKEQLGLIAQEVLEVSPGLVRDDGEYLGIRYSILALKVAKALQEVAANLDALTARVEALEA